MEVAAAEHIVIVGAGIGGLTTALALHRMGIKSLILESSDSLRTAGFAFTTWTNAWKVLDMLGLGDQLRQHHQRLIGIAVTSMISGQQIAYIPYIGNERRDLESRCIRRNMLLEALEEQLPSDTIRYSSKVVAIEETGYFKRVHLADGTVHKAKVLIGCDGVNSVVAKWLSFKKLASPGRSVIRGLVDFKESHGLEPKFLQFVGRGFRSGLLPCNDKTVYWFFTWNPTREEELEEDPIKLKQIVLTKFGKMPDYFRDAIENTELDNVLLSTLKFRYPWEIFNGNISKGNVCVVGDAFHPMTPDIGQGACSTLEDSIVLARCLAEALTKNPTLDVEDRNMAEEYERIGIALKKYAKERKWRAIDLVTTSYIVGYLQESSGPSGKVISFLRDKILAAPLTRLLQNKADYECGNLDISRS